MKIIKYESEMVFNLINNAVMTFNNLAFSFDYISTKIINDKIEVHICLI